MQCPSCDCQNSEVAKFCDACGTALPLHCPACGAPNRTSAKFCNECGVALGRQPPPKGPAAHATVKPAPIVCGPDDDVVMSALGHWLTLSSVRVMSAFTPN